MRILLIVNYLKKRHYGVTAPSSEDFCNKLTDEGIIQSEYDRASKAWEHFRIQKPN